MDDPIPLTREEMLERATRALGEGDQRMDEMTKAAKDVLAERQRQIDGEGWTPEHDDGLPFGELASAAACYAMQTAICGIETRNLVATVEHTIRDLWPWAMRWWKPTSHRRGLVKAAALIIAEIERLDRKCMTPSSPHSGEADHG